MNDAILFLWGVLATLFAIGPLIVAAILDWRAKQNQ